MVGFVQSQHVRTESVVSANIMYPSLYTHILHTIYVHQFTYVHLYTLGYVCTCTCFQFSSLKEVADLMTLSMEKPSQCGR